MSIRVGEYIPQALICAIRSALVHVVILSPNYAQPEWSLDKLLLIVQTGAPIVPVFWQIRPSDVRMKNKNEVYAKAFRNHNQSGKFDSRTLEKWTNALRWVSLVQGFVISEGEEEEMLEKITTSVAQYIKLIKCQGEDERFSLAAGAAERFFTIIKTREDAGIDVYALRLGPISDIFHMPRSWAVRHFGMIKTPLVIYGFSTAMQFYACLPLLAAAVHKID